MGGRTILQEMRSSLVFVGIGALVIIIGAYAVSMSKASSPKAPMTSSLTLTSPVFKQGASIPSRFTCDGGNSSPPLSWSGVPEGAKSLVLIMDDPDVPKELRPNGVFDHWTLFNISPDVRGVPEGGTTGLAGANGAGRNEYTGPCPPPQFEPSEHRYFIRLYALDTTLQLPEGASKADILQAMEGHVLAEGELMGKYQRITK